MLDEADKERLRRCGRCQELQPLELFAWRRKARKQRDNYCTGCRAEYKREHYAANRSRYIARARTRKQVLAVERAAYLVELFRACPCVDCGETDPLVLEFDHLGDKSFDISRASETETGRRCSTRLPSARSFVQTVTGAGPRAEVGSHARW
jgi:hypothetical protein